MVAGGDGTVREVAGALVRTETTLAIVPLGTDNDLALSLKLPVEPDAICDLIEAGLTRRIDVGMADGEHAFFEVAGVGVDADLFPIGEEVKSGRFQGIGRAIRLALLHRQAFGGTAIRSVGLGGLSNSFRENEPLKRRRRRFRDRKSRVRLRCSFVAIGNGPYYGRNFNVCPGERFWMTGCFRSGFIGISANWNCCIISGRSAAVIDNAARKWKMFKAERVEILVRADAYR